MHNPSAGSSDDGDDMVRLIRGAGHEVDARSCKDADWQRCLESPGEVVAVAGGDGTVTRVAKLLCGRGVPIAILPGGTANNVARSLGLLDTPLPALVAGWAGARRVAFALGRAAGPWGSSLFVEGVGLGLFAWTMPEADVHPTLSNLSHAEAKVAYAIQMLRERLASFHAENLSATLDGEDISGRYLLLEALNTRYIGPNLFLAPNAKSDDQCLDVITVTEPEREQFEAYLASWQRGWHRPPGLTCRKGRRLHIEAPRSQLHVDDEVMSISAPGTIDVCGDAGWVEFLVPAAR